MGTLYLPYLAWESTLSRVDLFIERLPWEIKRAHCCRSQSKQRYLSVKEKYLGAQAPAFLRRGRQPEENISRARTVVSPRILNQSSLRGKRNLAM